MSRNKEKAQSSLNRFHALKSKEAGVLETNPNARPKYVQSVESLPQAEKWRSVVLGEISTKLTRIQDEQTSDSDLRELNDSLNKLFNEKRAWEYHIKALGGNDYINFGSNLNSSGILANIDPSGAQSKGYRYFGRAKELPDVKVILQAKTTKETSVESIKPSVVKDRSLRYYGYFDEKSTEKKSLSSSEIDTINNLAREFGAAEIEPESQHNSDPLLEYEKTRGAELLQEMRSEPKGALEIDFEDFESAVPTNEDVKAWLVQKKRQQLMNKLGME